LNGEESIDKNTKSQLSKAERVIHCLEDIKVEITPYFPNLRDFRDERQKVLTNEDVVE